LTVFVLAGGASLGIERPLPLPSPAILAAVLFLGLVATGLVFWLQLVLQRHTSATHTALIFALEPVFAALFSWLWIGEALTASVLIGGGLMLAGVIAAELPIRSRGYRRAQEVPETH
jgi:drug/metabolite transporter (DMT)-like permease